MMNAITTIPAAQQPAQRSHADTAAAALRTAITAAHGPLRDAVTAYRTAWAALTPDADLLEILRATGEIVLAAEMLVAASKQLETSARAALASCMSETGCPAVALASHTVHLGTKPDRVDAENQEAIPVEFMRTPPPAPDKVAIGKALRSGIAVSGARSSARPSAGSRSCGWRWSDRPAPAKVSLRCSWHSASAPRSG